MADIELVIKIPENEYRHIKEIYEKNDIVESTYSYIYYGTPLPSCGDCIERNKDFFKEWINNKEKRG